MLPLKSSEKIGFLMNSGGISVNYFAEMRLSLKLKFRIDPLHRAFQVYFPETEWS